MSTKCVCYVNKGTRAVRCCRPAKYDNGLHCGYHKGCGVSLDKQVCPEKPKCQCYRNRKSKTVRCCRPAKYSQNRYCGYHYRRCPVDFSTKSCIPELETKIKHLAPELVQEIVIQGLDGPSLLALCRVSKQFATLCRDDLLWKKLYQRDVDPKQRDRRTSDKTWRMMYTEAMKRDTFTEKLAKSGFVVDKRNRFSWYRRGKPLKPLSSDEMRKVITAAPIGTPYSIRCVVQQPHKKKKKNSSLGKPHVVQKQAPITLGLALIHAITRCSRIYRKFTKTPLFGVGVDNKQRTITIRIHVPYLR